MKRFILRVAVALLTFILGIWAFLMWETVRAPWKDAPRSDQLTLVMTAPTTVVRRESASPFTIYVTNNSDQKVTLVHPGDGSEVGWRTPIVQWSILENGDASVHPAFPQPDRRFSRCGNIDNLKWRDVFTLDPGETKQLEAFMPPFRKPGSYKVKFLYENRPSLEWQGYEMRIHHPLAMWRVRHSTECTLASNEISLTVIE